MIGYYLNFLLNAYSFCLIWNAKISMTSHFNIDLMQIIDVKKPSCFFQIIYCPFRTSFRAALSKNSLQASFNVLKNDNFARFHVVARLKGYGFIGLVWVFFKYSSILVKHLTIEICTINGMVHSSGKVAF